MSKWNNWGKPISYIVFMFIVVGVVSYYFGIGSGFATIFAAIIMAPYCGVFPIGGKSK